MAAMSVRRQARQDAPHLDVEATPLVLRLDSRKEKAQKAFRPKQVPNQQGLVLQRNLESVTGNRKPRAHHLREGEGTCPDKNGNPCSNSREENHAFPKTAKKKSLSNFMDPYKAPVQHQSTKNWGEKNDGERFNRAKTGAKPPVTAD